jgi:hypothetical protein
MGQSPCQTCNHLGPDGHNFRHPFTPLGGMAPPLQTPADPTPTGTGVPAPWPFDPVLRMALITKGVLTVDDLRKAEDTIRATNGQVVVNDGSGKRTATAEADSGSSPVREPVAGIGD